MNFISTAVLFGLLVPALVHAAELGQRLDAEVTTSAGEKTRLKRYYGKPVLLFYEDPNSVKTNRAAKEALARLSLKWRLKEKVDVVAVANLQGWNWQPAIFFALKTVRGEEKKAAIPVLVDFRGSMQKAPWNLSARRSTILVLGPDGRVLFQSMGKLDARKFDELTGLLERLLKGEPVA